MRTQKQFHIYLPFFILLIVSGCIKDEHEPVVNYIEVGDVVPAFEVSDGKGNTFHSAAFRGKRSLLLFFDTTCGDCQREFPKIQEVWEAIRDKDDCLVITISRDQTYKETDLYWEAHNFTMPKYQDPDRSVYSLFATSVIPRIYIINEEGIVIWMAIESLEHLEDPVEDIINILLNVA